MATTYINNDLTLKFFEPSIVDIPNGLFADGYGGVVMDRNGVQITQLIIHFTAGWGAKTSVTDWKNRLSGGGSVATPFIIEGNVSLNGSGEGEVDNTLSNGQIYKVYNDYETKWTDHVRSGSIHERSIGIEVANLGHMRKDGDDFYFEPTGGSYKVNLLQDEIEIQSYSEEFRGKSHFHKINSSQLFSLKHLLIYLARTYDITMANVPENIGDYNYDVVSGEPGIYSHTNVVQGNVKWDWHPQPELVEMLTEIDNLSKAMSHLQSLKESIESAASITAGNKDDIISDFLDKVIGFYIDNGNNVFPLRTGLKAFKKITSWTTYNNDIFKNYPDFPQLDEFFPNILVPFVKEKYYDLVMDKVYRIYGHLSAAKYKEYYNSY